MGMMTVLLPLFLLPLLLVLLPLDALASFPTFQDTQCVGHTLNLACDSDHRIQVIHVIFGQAQECVFNPRGCMKQDHNFHPCTGLQICTVRAPPINIQGCGVSTYAHVTYNCIPVSDLHDICASGGQALTVTHGYLTTPGYPRILGLPSSWCSVRIHVPREFHIKLYLLDSLGSSLKTQANDCNVRLKVKESLEGRGGGDKQQVVTCLEASYLRNELIYTSFTSKIKLDIFVDSTYNFKKKKGILLYFEGILGKTAEKHEPPSMFVPTSHGPASIGSPNRQPTRFSLPARSSSPARSSAVIMSSSNNNRNFDQFITDDFDDYLGDTNKFAMVPTSYTLPPSPTPSQDSPAAMHTTVMRTVMVPATSTEFMLEEEEDVVAEIEPVTKRMKLLVDTAMDKLGNATQSHYLNGDSFVSKEDKEEEEGTGWAPIVGGVLSGVAIILLTIIVLVMLWEHRKRKIMENQTYMDILTASNMKPGNTQEGGATIYEDHIPTQSVCVTPLSITSSRLENGGHYNPGFSITNLEFDSSDEEYGAVDLDRVHDGKGSEVNNGQIQKTLTEQRIAIYEAAVKKSKEKGKKKVVANVSYDHVLPSIEEEEAKQRAICASAEAKPEHTYGKTLPKDDNEELYGKVVETPIPQTREENKKDALATRCNTLSPQEFLSYIPPPPNTSPPPLPKSPGNGNPIAIALAAAKAECGNLPNGKNSVLKQQQTMTTNGSNQDLTINIQLHMSNQDPSPARRKKGKAPAAPTVRCISDAPPPLPAMRPSPAARESIRNKAKKQAQISNAGVPSASPRESPSLRESTAPRESTALRMSEDAERYTACPVAASEKSTETGKPAPPVAPKPRVTMKSPYGSTGSLSTIDMSEVPDNTIMVENEVYGSANE